MSFNEHSDLFVARTGNLQPVRHEAEVAVDVRDRGARAVDASYCSDQPGIDPRRSRKHSRRIAREGGRKCNELGRILKRLQQSVASVLAAG